MHSIVLLFTVAVLLLTSLPLTIKSANAGQVTCKCTASDGTPVSDLVIDLENMTMTWGQWSRYTIRDVTDRYISAYMDKPNGVGGEVWVFDRATGNYLRANIGIYATYSEIQMKKPGKLEAEILRGKCTRPVL